MFKYKNKEIKYWVYYKDEEIPQEPLIITAEDYINAAKKFFKKYPKNYNCIINVFIKGCLKNKGEQSFYTAELFPDLISPNQIPPIEPEPELPIKCPNLDESKINRINKKILINILNQNSELANYVKNYDEDGFEINFPSPVLNSPPLHIVVKCHGDFEVDYGKAFFFNEEFPYTVFEFEEGLSDTERIELFNRDPAIHITKGIFECVDLVISEDRFVVLKKRKPTKIDYWELIGVVAYRKLLEEGKVEKAFSWKGTYNYPK